MRSQQPSDYHESLGRVRMLGEITMKSEDRWLAFIGIIWISCALACFATKTSGPLKPAVLMTLAGGWVYFQRH